MTVWRRWLAILAIAASVILLLWWIETAYAPLYSNKEHDYTNRDGYEQSPGDDLLRIIGIGFASLADAIEHHHDLWLVIETLVLALFTGTLWWSTRRLWQSSITHAGHAEQSIRVAEDTAQRQLRAYVSIGQRVEPILKVGTIPQARYSIVNDGQTPAYQLWNWQGGGIFDADAATREEMPRPSPEDSRRLGRTTLGPRRTFGIYVHDKEIVTDEMYKAIVDDKKRFFVWGEIYYIDAFKNLRQTKYRLDLGGSTMRSGNLGMRNCEKGNEAT